jgi:hypothetical protein
MSELVFTAGERATLDLRDSAGDVTVKDWDGPTIKVEAPATPYVLREQDTFRLRLPEGGVVSLPIGLPAEVLVPAAVRVRVTRAGGETDVRPVTGDSAGAARSSGEDAAPRDFTEFADVMADYGKRIFRDVARSVRSSGTGVSDDVARKLEEAAERIDESARRAAERVQREVDRIQREVGRQDVHVRRAAEHVESRARHVAERAARHAERHAERVARHAERAVSRTERSVERGARRGRWWFNEAMGQASSSATTGPRATEAERLAIMEMLRDGKVSAEQAATLLDALGG